jgi:hypothetical protein
MPIRFAAPRVAVSLRFLACALGLVLAGVLAVVAAAATSTSTTLTSSDEPGIVGQPITFTATVAGGAPEGVVRFTDGGVDLPACGERPVLSGQATCTVTYDRSEARTHAIAAEYGGDANTESSNATLAQRVGNRRATFAFTNGMQTFRVPDGITTLIADLFGAKGGSWSSGDPRLAGGGGRATAAIDVTPGEDLGVAVGGMGGHGKHRDSVGGNDNDSYAGTGGYNGGAHGGRPAYFTYDGSGGGGGATDVRRNDALDERVLVAGGGGGGPKPTGNGRPDAYGGAGGGLSGANGAAASSQSFDGGGGGGGTQSAGGAGTGGGSTGSFGVGGGGPLGSASLFTSPGGGGGGGWYGGGGGGDGGNGIGGGAGGGGGGGSGYGPEGTTFVPGVRQDNGAAILTWTLPHGVAADLGIAVQPTNTRFGDAIAPPVTVEIQDAYGDRASSSTAPVSIAVASGPADGTLSGPTVVDAVDGTAEFSGLELSRGGVYTLRATGSGLQSATTDEFRITVPTTTDVVASPATVPLGDAVTYTATVSGTPTSPLSEGTVSFTDG